MTTSISEMERQEHEGRMNDPYLSGCVICGQPAVVVCDMDDPVKDTLTDFCVECVEAMAYSDNFGRCYFCRDFYDHAHCIGVPCQCPCPPPDMVKREAERQAVLAKLEPYERAILGL